MHIIPGLHPGASKSVPPITSMVYAGDTALTVAFQITLPASIPGDLIVIHHIGTDAGGTPADVTPSGFTNAITQTWTESGLFMRWTISYKRAVGGESGATVNCLQAPARAFVFRPNRPLRTVTHYSPLTSFSTGDPLDLLLDTNAVAPIPSLTFGVYWLVGNGRVNSRSMTPTYDGEVWTNQQPSDRAWRWYFQPNSANDVLVGMGDEGNRNVLVASSFYVT